MRIFYAFIIFLFLLQIPSFAVSVGENYDMPVIKFKGNKYTLFYSDKNKDSNTYLNEYYKAGESYASWSEILAVHHFPNAYSPIDQAQMFKEYLSENGCPSVLEIDEDKNSAILDFIVINSKSLPIVLEFNVFKYEKDEICGTIALQYAKRYLISNRLDIDKIKKTFVKSRIKYVKQIQKLPIPELIVSKIDEGHYITKPVEIEKIPLQDNDIKE